MNPTSLTSFDAAAILVVLAAVFGYANHRLIKLPHTIGLTIMGALASLAVVAAGCERPDIRRRNARRFAPCRTEPRSVNTCRFAARRFGVR